MMHGSIIPRDGLPFPLTVLLKNQAFLHHVRAMTQQLSLTTLPDQPSYRVIDYLEVKDLARLCQTCKRLAAMVQDAAVWVNRPCVDLSGLGSQRGPWLDSHHVFQCLSGESAPTEYPLGTADERHGWPHQWHCFVASTKLDHFALLTREVKCDRVTYLNQNYVRTFEAGYCEVPPNSAVALVNDFVREGTLTRVWWKPGENHFRLLGWNAKPPHSLVTYARVIPRDDSDRFQILLPQVRNFGLIFLVTDKLGSLKVSPVPPNERLGSILIPKKEEITVNLPADLASGAQASPPVGSLHLPSLGAFVIRSYQTIFQYTKWLLVQSLASDSSFAYCLAKWPEGLGVQQQWQAVPCGVGKFFLWCWDGSYLWCWLLRPSDKYPMRFFKKAHIDGEFLHFKPHPNGALEIVVRRGTRIVALNFLGVEIPGREGPGSKCERDWDDTAT
jgi:hypothetical protein